LENYIANSSNTWCVQPIELNPKMSGIFKRSLGPARSRLRVNLEQAASSIQKVDLKLPADELIQQCDQQIADIQGHIVKIERVQAQIKDLLTQWE